MMRLILGSVLTAVAIFMWGFLFWGHNVPDIKSLEPAAETAVLDTLKTNIPADDVYYLPGMRGDEADWTKRHEAGPLAQITYRAKGANPMDPMVFVKGFAHMLVTALILGFALSMVAGGLPSYRQRVVVVVLFGLAASVFAHLSDPIWMLDPWRYSLLTALYDFVSYLLAGLILGWFVRGRVMA